MLKDYELETELWFIVMRNLCWMILLWSIILCMWRNFYVRGKLNIIHFRLDVCVKQHSYYVQYYIVDATGCLVQFIQLLITSKLCASMLRWMNGIRCMTIDHAGFIPINIQIYNHTFWIFELIYAEQHLEYVL